MSAVHPRIQDGDVLAGAGVAAKGTADPANKRDALDQGGIDN